jgi:hypothetical protein
MLPDFRFVFGATMATAVLGVATFGVVVSLRLAREAQMTPIDSSRPLAYANPGEWNHFYDATGLPHENQAQGPEAKMVDVAPATIERPGPPLVIVPEGVTATPGPAPDDSNIIRPGEVANSATDPTPAPTSDSGRTGALAEQTAASETNAVVADETTQIAAPDAHAAAPARLSAQSGKSASSTEYVVGPGGFEPPTRPL